VSNMICLLHISHKTCLYFHVHALYSTQIQKSNSVILPLRT
jgi:hypothetical protein